MAVTLSSTTSFPKPSFSLPSHSRLFAANSSGAAFSDSAPSNVILTRHRPLPTLALSRHGNRGASSTAPSASFSKKAKRDSRLKNDDSDVEEEEEEDAFETLFSMLGEDLENDESFIDDEDITEEDMDKLQSQLEEESGDEGGDERHPELKTWQLRRLAFALKTGRRKTGIKSLAAELSLDRAVVLEYLRDPPPRLVMMSAALPDEPAPRLVIPDRNPVDLALPGEEGDAVEEPAAEEETAPIHVMRHQWSARKRLKKVHVDTLEKVYRRTKRPTNAMISSIVQLTNLPRKRVVKWFEDKRAEDGVPDKRVPYKRLASESISSC